MCYNEIMKKRQNTLTSLEALKSDLFHAEDFSRAKALIDTWATRINLSAKHEHRMLDDLAKAICHLIKRGTPIDEIEKRLSADKIGHFYYEEPEEWYPLDTAATIYPLSMSRSWMPIFRLSAYLKEDICPELLQMALSIVICRFPYFSVTLGRGFFWYYMDGTRRHFRIKEESKRPFAVMNLTKFNAPCFRVIYYKKRISIEFFHLLTDGTGGMVFLKAILAEYFRLLGKEVPSNCDFIDTQHTPDEREWANDFHKADKVKASPFGRKRARQLRGSLSAQRPHQILHIEFDSDALRRISREKNSTVTAFLLTHLFFACKDAVAPGKGKIQIQVPCNMRKYYPSVTLRNFAMYCILDLSPEEIEDFDRVLQHLNERLKEETSKEALTHQMVAGTKLVGSLRFVPLFLKAPITRRFYPLFSDLILTTTLSNLGIISLPDSIADQVEKMDFVLGTTVQNRATCSMVTYRDRAVLSIFKATSHPGFEEALCKRLKEHGLTLTITGSQANGFHNCISEH